MIYIEDEAVEKSAIQGEEEVIIPIEVTYRNGHLEITAFERTLEIAKQLEKDFASNPFSKEAILFLDRALRDIVSSWGYFVDDLNEGHILTYESTRINEELIQPSTMRIKSSLGYENLTEYELDEIPSDSKECYFVTVIDNKIVSVCEMNTEEAFIGAAEINVFTASEYRGKGYGASNVTAMTKYLRENDKRVAYTASYDNKPSQLLALKCGFEEIAHTYYYICYKEE